MKVWRRTETGGGASRARRDDREYREYLREEQRSPRGCIARRMQPDFHHGLLGAAAGDPACGPADVNIEQLVKSRGVLVGSLREEELASRVSPLCFENGWEVHTMQPHSKTLVVLIVMTVAIATVSPPAWAQGGTSTATLSGKVVDQTGGRLPGVTITLTNLATNQSRSVVSNEEGSTGSPACHLAGIPFAPSSRASPSSIGLS